MRSRRGALVALIITVLLWGISFVSSKVCLVALPPMSLGGLRFLVAVALLWLAKRWLAPDERLSPRDLPALIGAGVFGVSAYFYCENTGLMYISASEASIIIGAIPVMTMGVERGAAAWRSRRSSGGAALPRLEKRRWAGALLSVVGVWMVAGASIAVTGSARGYLLMLGSAVSWVLYCFLTRSIFDRHSRIFIIYWQSLFGLLGFLPFMAVEFPRWGAFTLPVALNLVYLAVACSALGYLFYAEALAVLGVAVATIFINMVPVVTVAAGYLFLGERLSPAQWVGAAIVLAGVYLATLERGRRS